MKLGLRNSQKQEIRRHQGFHVVPHLPAPLSASPHTALLHYRKPMLTADDAQAFPLTSFSDVLMERNYLSFISWCLGQEILRKDSLASGLGHVIE